MVATIHPGEEELAVGGCTLLGETFLRLKGNVLRQSQFEAPGLSWPKFFLIGEATTAPKE